MPIHEYECPKCGHKFEILTLKMSEVKDKNECPECKHILDTRNVSTGAFIMRLPANV